MFGEHLQGAKLQVSQASKRLGAVTVVLNQPLLSVYSRKALALKSTSLEDFIFRKADQHLT